MCFSDVGLHPSLWNESFRETLAGAVKSCLIFYWHNTGTKNPVKTVPTRKLKKVVILPP